MTIMYDSTSAFDIPADAPAVAGYWDGKYAWNTPMHQRFQNTPQLWITVAGSLGADVIDVESGDATVSTAVDWVVRTREAGHTAPIVYTSSAWWSAAKAAFAAAGVPEPLWWIADWTGHPHLPDGAAACQYIDPPASGGHYDLSVISDELFESMGGTVALTQTDADLVASTLLNWYITTPDKPTGTSGRQVWDVLGDGERVQAALAADTTAVESAIHDAVGIGGMPTDPATLAAALAGPLASALSPYIQRAQTTPVQLFAALAAQLSKP